MDMGTSVRTCLGKYATFSGRASRSELWWFVLFNFICSIVAIIIDNILGTTYAIAGGKASGGLFYSLLQLLLLLPGLSVQVRRLHDRNRSGWWWWLVLIPVIGAIVLFVWFVLKGTSGANRYGEDPLAAAEAR